MGLTKRAWLVSVALAAFAGAILVGTFIVGPTVARCGAVSTDAQQTLVLSPDNHDCSYTVGVGAVITVEFPTREMRCRAFDICSSPVHQSKPLLFQEMGMGAFKEAPRPGMSEIHFTAVTPGTTELLPYRITIHVQP